MDKINELRLGLETAYIDGSVASDSFYCPQFVSNNYKSGKKVLSSIEDELLRCDKFQITYLMQKQSYEAMIDGIREKIEAQKEAIFTLENQMPSENSGIQFLEGKSEIAEITDELLDVLLDKVVVYADKTIELRWKFSNRSN